MNEIKPEINIIDQTNLLLHNLFSIKYNNDRFKFWKVKEMESHFYKKECKWGLEWINSVHQYFYANHLCFRDQYNMLAGPNDPLE